MDDRTPGDHGHIVTALQMSYFLHVLEEAVYAGPWPGRPSFLLAHELRLAHTLECSLAISKMPQRLGYSNAVDLTISLCLTYTLCVAGIRAWIRKGAYGLDDVVIAAATLVSLGHTTADYVALHDGLGTTWQHITNEYKLSRLNEAAVAGIVTFVTALYLSKCAALLFLTRVTKQRSRLVLYQICNAIIAAVGISSFLVLTIECPFDSGYTWAIFRNKPLGCPSQSVRWQIFTALDIVTEVLILVSPIQLVWSVQMPTLQKAKIIMAFCLRLPTIALSIARNYAILQLRLPSTDPGLMSGIVVIWIEIQLAYALASSTLSASKGFVENFNSGFGQGFVKNEGSHATAAGSAGSNPDRRSGITIRNHRVESCMQENTIGFADERGVGVLLPPSDEHSAADLGPAPHLTEPNDRSSGDDSARSASDSQTPVEDSVNEAAEWTLDVDEEFAERGWRPTSSIYSRGSYGGGIVERFDYMR